MLNFIFKEKEEKMEAEETPAKFPEPITTSTPLMTDKEIKTVYDKEKENFIKSSLQINSIDLESATERADIENQKLFQEIIDPTPSIIIDNKLNVDQQFANNDQSDQNDQISNSLKDRLDQTLEKARKKINSVYFSPPAIEEIPNNLLYPKEEQITTEDIYIDDSLKDLVDPTYFPQLSTDDRWDFEVDVENNEMILFKSPSLTAVVNIYRKDLNSILQNIGEDLHLNLQDMLMSPSSTQDTKQKKVILNQLIKRLETSSKKNIEKQIESHSWLKHLIDDQLNKHKDKSFSFGNYDDKTPNKNKFKNVTQRKKRYKPLYLKYLEAPSIYSSVPTNKRKKIESAKDIFGDIIKNFPPENYKKFKIDYDPSNNLTFNWWDESYNKNSQDELLKRVNNLFNNLQKNTNSVFYLAGNSVSKTLLDKAQKSVFEKDKVFVNLYKQLEDRKKIQKSNLYLPVTTPFYDIKSNVDHSTLFSISKPFELLHADIADTRFLAKSAVDPKYCLLLVDLFTSKVYILSYEKQESFS